MACASKELRVVKSGEEEMINMEMEECMQNGNPRDRVVCDFVASMTDRYALDLYTSIFFPSPLV